MSGSEKNVNSTELEHIAESTEQENSDGWDDDIFIEPMFDDLYRDADAGEDSSNVQNELNRLEILHSIEGVSESSTSSAMLLSSTSDNNEKSVMGDYSKETAPSQAEKNVELDNEISEIQPGRQEEKVEEPTCISQSSNDVQQDDLKIIQDVTVKPDSSQTNKEPEIDNTVREHFSVGTETSDLVLTIARSSSTDDSCLNPAETHGPTVMTMSISTASDGSEEERFVKVKPGDFEFESSKGSSQSGKDNLEFEEQILVLTSQCDGLRSDLAEKENDYLKVKLELESLLLEKNTEYDTLTKSSQQITRLKEDLFSKDEELMDIRSIVEESKQLFEKAEVQLAEQENREPNLEFRNLSQIIRSLILVVQHMPSACQPVTEELGYCESTSDVKHHQTTQDAARTPEFVPGGDIQRLNSISEENTLLNSALMERCAKLESSLASLSTQLAEALENQKTQKSAEKSINTASNIFTTIELDHTPDLTTNSEICKLNEILGEKEIYMQGLRQNGEELEIRLSSTLVELEELRERENDVIGGYQSVSASLEKSQSDCVELQRQLAMKELELTGLQESNRKTKYEIERFKEQLISKDEDLEELQTSSEKLLAASDNNESQFRRMITTLEEDIALLRENTMITLTKADSNSNVDIDNDAFEELRHSCTLKEEALRISTESLAANQDELQTTKLLLEEVKGKFERLEEKFRKALMTIKQKNTLLTEIKESELNKSSTSLETENMKFSELKADISQLQSQLKENDIVINQLQLKLNDSEDKFQALLSQKSMLELAADIKNEELHAAREQLSHFVGNLADKNVEFEELMKNVGELEGIINRQNEDLTSSIALKDEEIRKTMQQYEEYYQQSQEQINQLTYNLQAKVDEISSLKDEFTDLEKELTAVQREGADLRRLLQTSDQAQQQLGANLQECNSLLEEKKLELQLNMDERYILQDKVGELMIELKKKSANINQLDEILSVKLEGINLMEFSINEFKETIDENTVLISELKTKLEEQNYELEESRKKEEDALAYKESYKELLQLKRDFKQAQLQLTDSESRFQQITNEYDRKATEIELLKDAEVFGTRNELSQMKEERDRLENYLQQSRSIILTLESDKSNWSTKMQQSESSLTDSANRINLLEDELRLKTSFIVKLEDDTKQLRESVESLRVSYNESQSKLEEITSKAIQQQSSRPTFVGNKNANNAKTANSDELVKLLEEEKAERHRLERKVELLQTKIYEIEVSEMKSFEECLMLKSWMREVELENIKYAEELRRFQSTAGGENPKLKTLKDEILRLIQSLEDRDRRSAQLTMEITRLYEERDGLQLKLSNVLKHVVTLNEKISTGQPSTENIIEAPMPIFYKDELEKKLAQLEDINYSINVDLKREKEARRLVQEQLLFSQTSRFYRDRQLKPRSTISQHSALANLPNPGRFSVEAPPVVTLPESSSLPSVPDAMLPSAPSQQAVFGT